VLTWHKKSPLFSFTADGNPPPAVFFFIFSPKHLVISKKSSTFAAENEIVWFVYEVQILRYLACLDCMCLRMGCGWNVRP